jgi:transposase
VSTAVQQLLDGMPEPSDLHLYVQDGRTVVMVGSQVVAGWNDDDLGMRNMAVVTLTELGFACQRVAEVMGWTPQYVSMLRGRVRREGSAGLVRLPGRPGKLSSMQVRKAAGWRRAGESDVAIASRLGVTDKTVAKALRQAQVAPPGEAAGLGQQEELFDAPVPAPVAVPQAEPASPSRPQPAVEAQTGPACPPGSGSAVEPAPGPGPGPGPAGAARIGVGAFGCRYAGVMLLHAFGHRVDAERIFDQAAQPLPRQRFDDVAVLASMSSLFALGFSSVEQAKHPDRAQVGPTVGIGSLPELRTLRPRLAAIADACDPLALQRAFAAAMLAADPNQAGVYFVDDHFVPYAGALPVDKGWNTKRRHAQPGRADTMICDWHGRALCFTTGEPSGLATTLPGVLAQLKQLTGEGTPIMLGFDRGGAYPTVFRTCREQQVHWITYRRAPLSTPGALPVAATLRRGDQAITIVYTDEQVTINGYGTARQLTLFEHGKPVLQILTSDTQTCAGALIWFMRARWRIENLFKYLDFYGIDWLADYHATLITNTRKIDNPERKAANTRLKALSAELAALQQRVGELAGDRALSVAATNRAIATTQRKITTLDKRIEAATTQRNAIPAKLPANQIDPEAKRAIHRAHRRGLQMVLRLLAHNAEHWLAHRLNAYLQDPNEYRAATRNLMHLGGTITYTPNTIIVHLDQPNSPRLATALGLLLQEINNTPPRMPGDPRPITYMIHKA